MTKEEAIKAIGLMEHVESIIVTYEPGEIREDTTVRELKEACRMAVSDLHAQQKLLEMLELDRSAWELCSGCQANRFFGSRFCGRCGRPLTEGAWAELGRRLIQ